MCFGGFDGVSSDNEVDRELSRAAMGNGYVGWMLLGGTAGSSSCFWDVGVLSSVVGVDVVSVRDFFACGDDDGLKKAWRVRFDMVGADMICFIK